MKLFDASATRTALSFERLVPALREAFASDATVPSRHVLSIGDGAERGTVLIMPAWNAHAVADQPDALALAVRAADIVSCATLATAPLVRGEWLAPGTHLDLIGSFTPAMKEADPACFGHGARVFVDTDEALLKAGDLLDAIAAGTLAAADVRATLAQLCRCERKGRSSGDERTVFKAVGTALEDLTAATLVWRGAEGQGLA